MSKGKLVDPETHVANPWPSQSMDNWESVAELGNLFTDALYSS